MAESYRLDDKYTSGVWYDMMNGDYCEIRQEPGLGDIELINPNNGTVYYTIPVRKWVESEQSDFRPVSEEAVNDPTRVVNRAIRMMRRNDVNELAGYPEKEAVDLRYAHEQVEISEK